MRKKTNKELLQYWDDYRNSLLANTYVEKRSAAEIQKHRHQLEEDPIEWIKFFFPKFAYAEFATFQKQAIRRLTKNMEWYEVLSWSRELSKTTITMFVVMYLALTGKKKNILLVSNSKDNADRLLEPYRANMDSNQRIITYYGNQYSLGKWEMGEFTTAKGVAFRAIGAGQSPRGTKNDEFRPDEIIIDDFDTDEDCRNPEVINKKWNWFEGALYPTRSINNPLQVIWCGNIIAKDCAIVRAGKIADNHDIINIRDKNGKSSWPQKNTEEHIDRVLSKISTRAAQQEYFNNPVSVGDVFTEMHWGKVPPLFLFPFLVCYGDPAPSNTKNKAGSFKGVFLLGVLDGKFYVITGYLDHATNSEYVDWMYYVNEYVKNQKQIYFFTENNSLQDPFYQQVFLPLFIEKGKEHGYYLAISPDIRVKPDKFSRIEGNLEPLNRQGRLILNEDEKGNPHMQRLEDQFLMVNPKLSAPADGPDCVEGGVWICNMKQGLLGFESFKTGKRPSNKKRV